MLGGIYENKGEHGSRWVVRFPGGVFKRFQDRGEAERFLTGLRFKRDEGSFDARDYHKDQPLGVANLTQKYIETKRVKCLRNIKDHLRKACVFWGNRNIKTIEYGDLEDLLSFLTETYLKANGEPLKSKSIKNIFISPVSYTHLTLPTN